MTEIKEIINPKQVELLKTAKILFWKFGIKRVTVAEICKEANVSKMTFYKFFNNKMEIAKVILEELANKSLKDYQMIMEQDLAFATKIEQVIQLKLNNTHGIGKEFIKDIYGGDLVELQELIAQKRKIQLNRMLQTFKQAAEKGDIRSSIKPESILYFLNQTQKIATDDHFLAMYSSQQEAIMELTRFFFYGLGIAEKS